FLSSSLRAPTRHSYSSLNPTSTPAIAPLSLHDALPISWRTWCVGLALAAGAGELRRLRLEARQRIDVGLDLAGGTEEGALRTGEQRQRGLRHGVQAFLADRRRSEEHTSELQSRENLVCR